MLEQIDLEKSLDKDTYRELIVPLRNQLMILQQEIRDAGVPVLIVFEGWETSGKGDLISHLSQRLDPRWVQTYLIDEPVPEETLRPFLWRYWVKTPGRGEIAIFNQSWYRTVLVERFLKRRKRKELPHLYREIVQFERQLVDDGAKIIKFWLHISPKEQKNRAKQILKDPTEAWQISKSDQKQIDHYDEFGQCVEEMLERCSPHFAPWTIVEANCRRHARVKVFEALIQNLQHALAEAKAREQQPALEISSAPPTKPTILDRVDLETTVDRDSYDEELPQLQVRMRELEFELFRQRIPLVILYEGWDAGGKGGNIRRLVEKLDPRGYRVTPIAAPTTEEKDHHFLWRFWKPLQKAGHISIFDRSWYGRVLVERVEGFCRPDEWWRAYQEINEFEEQLWFFGTIIVKFWVHISPEEQLQRFEDRQNTPHKRWKITDEDWRNREKWDEYEHAVIDMLQRTSTTYAPWVILEGNCKLHARLQALRTVVQRVEEAIR